MRSRAARSPPTHLKFIRIQGMQTWQHRWLYGVLQEVYHHQNQRVTGYGHVFCIVDVMELSPDFHNQRQRPETPIHWKRGKERQRDSIRILWWE